MIRLILWMVASFLLSGCANVYFGQQIQDQVDDPDSVHVYLDRVGSLYPGKDIRIHDAKMPGDGTLKACFRIDAACAVPKSAPVGPGSEWKAVEDARSLGGSEEESWQFVQTAWAQQTAERLAAMVNGTNRTLVVLIHGFNVKNASEAFRSARAKVTRASAKDNPVFLLVHWDGRSSPTGVGVWGHAQVNGFLAGFYLRRILAQVAPETPVRVMTHSSGAFVLSATLGDPREAFVESVKKSPEFREFNANINGAERFPLPRSRDLRVALIAPATPPATYAGTAPNHVNHVKEAYRGILVPAQLIIGVNKDDWAISKGPLDGRWSAFGSAALGAGHQGYCDLRDRLAGRRMENPSLDSIPVPLMVDFAPSKQFPRFGYWQDHAWTSYLERDRMGPTIDLLLGVDTAFRGDAPNCKSS